MLPCLQTMLQNWKTISNSSGMQSPPSCSLIISHNLPIIYAIGSIDAPFRAAFTGVPALKLVFSKWRKTCLCARFYKIKAGNIKLPGCYQLYCLPLCTVKNSRWINVIVRDFLASFNRICKFRSPNRVPKQNCEHLTKVWSRFQPQAQKEAQGTPLLSSDDRYGSATLFAGCVCSYVHVFHLCDW